MPDWLHEVYSSFIYLQTLPFTSGVECKMGHFFLIWYNLFTFEIFPACLMNKA